VEPSAVPAAPTVPLEGVAVLTQHNDNARTGANLNEVQLTTSTVAPGHFGLLFSLPVDGQIYTQPLYAPNVRFVDGNQRNVVFVATMHNSVYAFDADGRLGTAPIWQEQLGDAVDFDFFPMVTWFLGKYNIYPEIGITSTPVIDLSAGRIYVVAKVRTHGRRLPFVHWGESVVYRLHALDIRTGHDVAGSPVDITATVPGWGRGSRFGTVKFDAVRQLQRPGLLLSGGLVYVAFASHQDTEPYHGWILGYDGQTLRQTVVFCTTCGSFWASEGGIWQAGNGPAADADGNVFVMTGNGTWNPARNELGTSFIKLTPRLEVASWFTPANHECLNHIDADLGSAGPLLVPNTNLMVGGGKEGVIYLLRQDKLGGLEPHGTDHAKSPCDDAFKGTGQPPLSSIQASPPYDEGTRNAATVFLNTIVPQSRGFHYHHIHGSPVFWETPAGHFIYVWAERDSLRAYRLDVANGTFQGASSPGETPQSTFWGAHANGMGMPGAALSLSSNGSAAMSGIVWASLPKDADALTDIVPGVLRAFAALPVDLVACNRAPTTDACVLPELWNSMSDPVDSVGLFAKYAPPTIANGKVYMPTFSRTLRVYGLRDQVAGRPAETALTAGAPDAKLAAFGRQIPPPQHMEPGQQVDVSVTMRNTGRSAWTSAAGTGLVSQNPSGNLAWRRDSLVPLTRAVPPGSEYTFKFSVRAPREGRLNFQWRMTARGAVFGDTTPNAVVSIVGPRCAALREEQRRMLALAVADTGQASAGRDAARANVDHLSSRLTDLTERLTKDRCAMRADAAFPDSGQ
jgi:hypothetical protein